MKFMNKLTIFCVMFLLAATCFFGTKKEVRAADGDFLPKIEEANGGKETINLSFSPDENAPGNLQYYVYLDNVNDPVWIINPRREAEKCDEKYDCGNGNSFIDGTKNGAWTKYNNVDLKNGKIKFTACYSVPYTNTKIEVYADEMNEAHLIGTLNLTQTGEWSRYTTDSVSLDNVNQITGTHDIYLKYVGNESYTCNVDWFSLVTEPLELELTNVAPGHHTVSIKTYTEGSLSIDTVDATVDVEAPLNDRIGIEGFQIRTNDTEKCGVSFRTVCKAPNVGSTIQVDGISYQVKDIGTIYVLDMNDNLDESYTYLNPNLQTKYDEEGNPYTYYPGDKDPLLTYGYIATQKGILNGWNVSDSEHTYYIRTMQNMDSMLEYTIYVRAFVVGEDSQGKQLIIYGDKVTGMSIPEVADYLYKNSMASNYQGHRYLYSNILNQISPDNPYYRNETVDYGWNDNLFTPSNPTAIYPTEYESAK